MKTQTKAILAGTLLTALFAGQSAIAGDNDHFAKYDGIDAQLVEQSTKVNYVIAPLVDEATQGGRK